MENVSEHIMKEHKLSLMDREKLNLTGVSDVDSFNEQQILAVVPSGELTIRGEMLHIEELNLDSGVMAVSGKIVSLTYSEKFSSSSMLKRLFGG